MFTSKNFVCTTCGYVGKPRNKVKGSFVAEIVLWLLGIGSLLIFPPLVLIPIVYSLWRLLARTRVCKKCENTMVIPTDTPRGKELLAKQSESTKPSAGTQGQK